MNETEAAQIAALLNARNSLTVQYDVRRVMMHASQYRLTQQDGLVVACVQLRPVQWYQWEVLHLSVHEQYVRRGLGAALLAKAIHEASASGVELLQCTIRAGNAESEKAFARAGFQKVNSFCNDRSGNVVGVWQCIVPPRRNAS